MSIKAGDRVSFLNEVGTGTVISVSGASAMVLNEDGFEEEYPLKELVLRKALKVQEVPIKDRLAASKSFAKGKAVPKQEIVVDLHFDSLVEYPKNYQPYEILSIQLREVEKALTRAKKAGIKKVILIHGVGQGRLREEVHTLLERKDNLQFYDASLARFGQGATEVQLY
jgi:hypothetical protein